MTKSLGWSKTELKVISFGQSKRANSFGQLGLKKEEANFIFLIQVKN
jgi:hypothetical protein